jgi:hypothetical protein
LLKSEWDAWISCAGIPVEKAMQEYIDIINSLESSARFKTSLEVENENNNPSRNSSSESHNIQHANETLSYIPEDLLPKIEQKAQIFLDMIAPDAIGWDPLFEQSGLIAKKKSLGNILCVKGEIQFPYNLLDVFRIIIDTTRQVEIVQVRAQQERIKKYSHHTWIEYLRFKRIWPTSTRDFVTVNHWRMLNDGSVIFFGFSATYDELKALVNEHIRGEMFLSGYHLIPNAQGTKVYHLYHVSFVF